MTNYGNCIPVKQSHLIKKAKARPSAAPHRGAERPCGCFLCQMWWFCGWGRAFCGRLSVFGRRNLGFGGQNGATVQLTRQKGKITKGKVKLPVWWQKAHWHRAWVRLRWGGVRLGRGGCMVPIQRMESLTRQSQFVIYYIRKMQCWIYYIRKTQYWIYSIR